MKDKDEQPLTADDVEWIDDPLADEGIYVFGVMTHLIKDLDLLEHIDNDSVRMMLDAADFCREVLVEIVIDAQRNKEVEQLEELWTLN